MKVSANSGFLKKYSILIVAIVSFFFLSIGIFSFNFFVSQQLGEDAAKINNSGKMRGLTQQNAKAVLSLVQELAANEMIQTSQAQISESILGMEGLIATVRTTVDADKDKAGLELLDRFQKSWEQVAILGKQVATVEIPDPATVDGLRSKSNAVNVRLLSAADDLTQHFETAAAARANQLKLVQAVAIAVALINFLFIVLYAFRSLARSDRIAKVAKHETEQILGTVREGLFLVDKEWNVGHQRSSKLDQVFPKPLPPGTNFREALSPLVSKDTLEAVENYIGLLFNKRVKLSLVESLNPLDRVEVSMPNKGPGFSIFLSFKFSPVYEDGVDGVSALLVSVVDISQEVFLEHELENAEVRAKSDIALLLGVLDNDPAVVGEFLAAATSRLDELNTMLRDIDPRKTSYADVINPVFRVIHSIKGEAATLTLGPISQEAHDFEDVLVPLRRKELTGADLIPVATGIAGMQQAIAKVARITDRITSYAGHGPVKQGDKAAAPQSADEDVQKTIQRIQRLALSVATDLNKKIRVETSLAHVESIPESIQRLLREGLPQLVRNAIVHGIEASDERTKSGKPAEGLVRIELNRNDTGGIEIVVIDDGRGIDVNKLRRKLVAMGKLDAHQVSEMSDRDVVAMIFQPGVSTADVISDHAGRGFGLDVLLNLVRNTGARLRVASRPQINTSFTLQWSPAT